MQTDDDPSPRPVEDARTPHRRPAGWALGLPALALLSLVAAMRIGPAVEINIRREAAGLARGEAGAGLAQAGGRITVAGRDVRIVTDAELPEPAREEARRRAAAIRGVRGVVTEATGYIAMSPFVFRVRRSEVGIELSGGVPDVALRNRLVALAARFVTPDLVEDRLRLAGGAPEGFAAAAAHLVATLGAIESAEGSLSDRRLEAAAQPRDPASYNAVMTALRDIPAGYAAAEIDILPPRIAPFVWTARRDAGGIALGGAVPSEEMRAALLRLADEILPGLPVRDAMQTARGLDRSVDFLATARPAFDALLRLVAGEAQIADRRFALTGDTVAKGGVAAVERRLRETLPSALGAPMVSLTVVPASPFVFGAKRAGGRLELSGYLADEAARAAIAGLAAQRFPGERVVDRLVVADGAPDGFAAATRTALETLSDFADGEAAILDRDLRYSGRVLYAQLAARIRRTAPRQVPEGWRASVELEPVRPVGALDAYLCSDLLGDTARKLPVRFVPGQAEPASNAGPALEAAAGILRRCGRIGIRLVHHLGGGDPEAARELAAERARVLAAALSSRGATARFTAEGASAAEKDAERTEFVVAPL